MEQVTTKRKTSKTRHKFQITDRDKNILRYIGENRFITYREIRRKFWPGCREGNVCRRLKVLRCENLIERLMGDGGIPLGYKLGKKGKRLLERSGFRKDFLNPHMSYRTTFNHDEKLLKVREVLEKSPLVSSFTPEHAIRVLLNRRHHTTVKTDKRFKVPDAIFRLKTTSGIHCVALELECAQKSYRRYRQFLVKLSESKDVGMVFIICENSKILLILRDLLSELRQKDPKVKRTQENIGFYFSLLENLLNDGLNAVFDGEGKRFSLNSLNKEIAAIA